MRDYDPTTGRYIQADRLVLIDGPAIYGYARQSPGIYADPTGQCPWCVVATGAIIGAVTSVALDYLIDQIWGDGCYTWKEPGTAAFFGGLLGGAGGAVAGVVRGGFGAASKGAMGAGATKGLGGNPFKGKTPDQIQRMFQKKGFIKKGPNPGAGQGQFVNPRTGRGYHVDAAHGAPKGPHVGTTRPKGKGSTGRRGRAGRDFPM